MRWQRLLEELGHSTELVQSWEGDEAQVLIALHARKSFDSIRRFHEVRKGAPLVVTLTGTDLYRDLDRSEEVLRAVDMATRVVALQPAALERLPRAVHDKVHIILQSAEPPPSPRGPRRIGLKSLCFLTSGRSRIHCWQRPQPGAFTHRRAPRRCRARRGSRQAGLRGERDQPALSIARADSVR